MTPQQLRWVRRAWLLLVAFAIAAGCSPEYRFVPDPVPNPDGGPPPPPSTPTACSADEECAELAATQICDSRTGYCAECEPGREAELNRCGEGLICDSLGRCAVGCAGDADCLGISCDVERGLCTGCTGDVDCTPGTRCEGAVCVAGCGVNEDCPWGWLCCGGSCRNPETDAASCGACGVACARGGECWNGVCGSGRCEDGLAECDGDAANGCETEIRQDPSNCGRCRVACASNFCSGGVCTTMGCQTDFADCNQAEDDGCETNLRTTSDCLMCGKACSAVHGEPSCTDDGCAIACEDGYEDCDEEVDTGCETKILDDDENCGACGVRCVNDNGSTRCVEGECVPRCAEGFDDCDGDATNGCETDVRSSLANCGGCGDACRPGNATGSCEDGVCEVTCSDGYRDCDGSAANGCEVDLSSPETCGSCTNRCSDAGGTAICGEDGSCSIECDAAHRDCLNGVVDGCETDIQVSARNCGACGNVCDDSLGRPACEDGVCVVSECAAPNAECVPDDGAECETNITTSEEHCGDCGLACAPPSASGECRNGACTIDECDEGYADCDDSVVNGCEIRLGTREHCRSCGEVCTNEHGTTACGTSGCAPVCAIGWGDCDGNKDNGCETQLNTLFNCGGCGVACTKAHGTETCVSGSCEIEACDEGWDDCDSQNEAQTRNGCETPLNTLENCNGCGVVCNLAGGSESCATGTCVLTGCDSNRADCTSQAGCETTLGTTQNCLGCGDACTNVHGPTTCIPLGMSNAGCAPSCDAGWKSCDGDRGNGCETNIRTLTNCGDCGVACSQPNATASCSTGTCTVSACNTTGGPANQGYLDCTTGPGCETPRGTTSNCRSCNESCTNAHGTTACNMTSGCTFTCSPASEWDNCDNNPNNGCETSLTTLASCGSCGQVCDLPGSNESCSTGSCIATTCATGFENCSTSNPDCETQLGTVSNCKGCADTCTNAHGTTACSGSAGSYACTPSCDAGWKSCDAEPDNGCERNIRTLTDCGDCNVACSLPHATATCSTGSCAVSSCDAGYLDCTSAPGCETQLGTVSNCAACGNACTNDHGGNACAGSPGSYDCNPSCDSGWRSCDGNPDNGCETPLNTLTNCGNCGVACNLPNGSESCASGTCTLTGCSAGFADCTSAAGCETQLGTAANCAACGNACTNPHGTTACTGSAGSYDCAPSCEVGWKSCDSNPDNGCERSIRTLTDCNDCGIVCSFPNAAASCSTGTCTQGACNAGFGDCTAAPGCETTLGTSANCAACGNTCSNSHGTNTCAGTPGNYDCAPTCDAGFGNCDGNPDNGCEADLSTPAACGACGNTCGGATPNCVASGGTYRCTAQITTAGEVDGTRVGSSLTLNHDLQSGSNRAVVLALLASSVGSTGIAGARPEVVTYGGVNMIAGPELSGDAVPTSPAFRNIHIFYYYLTDGSTPALPSSGSNPRQVVMNGTGGVGVPEIMFANVVQWNGVRQTAAPEAPIVILASGVRTTNTGGLCTLNVTGTPPLAGARIYSFSGGLYAGSPSSVAVSPSSGLTVTNFFNSGDVSQIRAYGSYVSTATNVALLSNTSHTVSLTYAWCSPAIHQPIVVFPATSP